MAVVEPGVQAGRWAAAGVPLVLVPALGLDQGGFHPGAWVWAGALAAWASAVAIVTTANPGALRRGWPWAAAAVGLLLWTTLSASWSAQAAQSLLDARRTLVYAASLVALLLLVRPSGSRLLVPATHAAITVVLLYALARYLFGPRRAIEFEGHLLNRPLGYANAVGILAAIGIVLAVGIAAGHAPLVVRAAAAATVPLLAVTLLLSGSTASWLALAVGTAVSAVVSPATPRLLIAAVAVGPFAALAVGLGRYSRLADAASAPRLSGPALGVAVLGCAALAALALAYLRFPGTSEAGRRNRRVLLAAVLVAAVGGAVAIGRAGATEPRASYFAVAWHDEVTAHPVLGTGAGTFGLYWARSGKQAVLGGALDAHSLYLETLAELGPVGLLLVGAMLLAPLHGSLRRRRAPYVPGAIGAYAAFLVHAGLDWDWEMPAVVVAGLCCAAAVAAAELPPQRPLGARTRAALLVLVFVLGGCAIAGARSRAVPAAFPQKQKAPPGGAFSHLRASRP
jgi:hypothetical protein